MKSVLRAVLRKALLWADLGDAAHAWEMFEAEADAAEESERKLRDALEANKFLSDAYTREAATARAMGEVLHVLVNISPDHERYAAARRSAIEQDAHGWGYRK